jgi:hypothetical protein
MSAVLGTVLERERGHTSLPFLGRLNLVKGVMKWVYENMVELPYNNVQLGTFVVMKPSSASVTAIIAAIIVKSRHESYICTWASLQGRPL